MKQPWYKVLLSHLIELHIESAPNAINPHLYISLYKGRYQLATAKAVYSWQDLYDNFGEAFRRLRWDHTRIENVLLLGFGLGSIPYILEKKHRRRLNFTAVEIDADILYLAKKYAMEQLDSPVEFQICDAEAFMRSNARKFDLICMDVFIDDVIPAHLQTMEFLQMLRNALAQDGILMYNRLSRSPKDLEETQAFYDRRFKQLFAEAGYLDVDGNWILTNRPEVFNQSTQ